MNKTYGFTDLALYSTLFAGILIVLFSYDNFVVYYLGYLLLYDSVTLHAVNRPFRQFAFDILKAHN